MSDALDGAVETLATTLTHLAGRSLATVFAPSFFVHTPEPLLRTRLEYLLAEFGVAEEVRIVERLSERSARIRARFAKGYAADGEIAVDDGHPPHIQWLRFDLPTRESDSWADIEHGVQTLAGRAAFEVRDLTHDAPLAGVHADVPLGAGSVSKLVLLLCLLEDVGDGRRRWDDIVTLEPRHRSLPTGLLQDWPPGAPLTLHTLAVLLCSVSDNTAADLLLDVLGAERVEATLARLDLADPQRHVPFFSTRGLFALVAGPESRRQAWAAASTAERRTLLAAAAAEPLPDVGQVSGPWPAGWDWVFSATELGRVLRALRVELERTPAGRALLAINTGGLSLGAWPFCGFKGGSSPGRLAFAVLLLDERQTWYGITLLIETTPEALRIEAAAQLIKRAADQLRAHGAAR